MSTPENKAFWLIKFAPFRTSWAEIVRRGSFAMRGVRNSDARDSLTALRRKFEDIYAPSHPDRAALQKLHTLDPIRIIEGKA